MNLRFDFIGLINDENVLHLRNYICEQKEPIDHLLINISSLGGTIASAITAYNYLKQQSFHITTHNLGEVSSSAILLYLAGTTRTAESISKFMFHPAKIDGEKELTYCQVQELLKNIEADIKNYSSIVNQETNHLNGMFDVDKFLRFDAVALGIKTAHKCGIVTEMSV